MAQFNINEGNKSKYEEVSFQEGLRLLRSGEREKMYSDGLEFDEYIKWAKDHFEYEDGCYIGVERIEIFERIGSWIYGHKFYVDHVNMADKILRQYENSIGGLKNAE